MGTFLKYIEKVSTMFFLIFFKVSKLLWPFSSHSFNFFHTFVHKHFFPQEKQNKTFHYKIGKKVNLLVKLSRFVWAKCKQFYQQFTSKFFPVWKKLFPWQIYTIRTTKYYSFAQRNFRLDFGNIVEECNLSIWIFLHDL